MKGQYTVPALQLAAVAFLAPGAMASQKYCVDVSSNKVAPESECAGGAADFKQQSGPDGKVVGDVLQVSARSAADSGDFVSGGFGKRQDCDCSADPSCSDDCDTSGGGGGTVGS